jgi:hypothetical protein
MTEEEGYALWYMEYTHRYHQLFLVFAYMEYFVVVVGAVREETVGDVQFGAVLDGFFQGHRFVLLQARQLCLAAFLIQGRNHVQ